MYTGITRKKNAYTFHFPNGQVVIDLDKRDEPIIGVSGKALKGAPRNVMQTNLGHAIYKWYADNYAIGEDTREIVDRCISLGLKPNSIEGIFTHNRYLHTKRFFEKKNWKRLVSYIRENEDSISNWDLAMMLENLEIADACKGNGYTQEEIEIVNKFFARYSYRCLTNNNVDTKEFLKLLKPMLESGRKFEEEVISFAKLIDENTTAEFRRLANINYASTLNYNHMISELISDYSDYNKIVKKWNLPKQSGNFYKRLEVAKKIDREYSKRPSDEIFRLRQESREFAYEDDEIIVEVPKTREECEEIGKEFRNCVGGWEWNTRLSNGYANLVVIREKGKNRGENKVCCDIIDGKINQYYAPCNSLSYSSVLREFRVTYQTYLDSLYID